MQICIYTPIITSRIQYIVEFIFQNILGIKPALTSNLEYFQEVDVPKLSYGVHVALHIPYFASSDFLLETEIIKVRLDKVRHNKHMVPFAVSEGAFPFDVFAASFYIITRFEEFVHKKYNKHLFTADDSLQYKDDYLDEPIVDLWAHDIKDLLIKRYPNMLFPPKSIKVNPIIHAVPNPPKPSGIFSRSKRFLEDITHQDGRKKLLDSVAGLGSNEDDNLDFLNALFFKNKLMAVYFINAGSYDKIDARMQNFMSKISRPANVGLFHPCEMQHPNPAVPHFLEELGKSHLDPNLLTHQLDQLYIPTCYIRLQSMKVLADFSMGYKNHLGFRAGTSTPHKWYDLPIEKTTELKIFPYCATDAALMELGRTEGAKQLKNMIDRIKMVSGTFSISWELKNLSNNVKFKKWRAIYEELTNYATNGNEHHTPI